jgi:S-DNA-T family DNA segregation ATPase FtsK/SpoIIIE
MVLPVLVALLAWRLLRHPERNEDTGRVAIGASALVAGILGITHISAGTPFPDKGMNPVRKAGGVVGWLVAAPPESLLGAWVAVPLLILLSGFGLLVVTATPVHRIPERLTQLWDLIMLRQWPTGDDEAAGGGKGGKGGKPRPKDRKPDVEVGDHKKPYDTPVVQDKPARRTKQPPVENEFVPDLVDELMDPEPMAVPDEIAPLAEVRDPTPAPPRSEQLPLSSSGEIYGCWSSSTWTRRSRGSPAARRSRAMRSS